MKFYEFSRNCRHVYRKNRYNHEFFRFILNTHCCRFDRHSETKFKIEIRRKIERLR